MTEMSEKCLIKPTFYSINIQTIKDLESYCVTELPPLDSGSTRLQVHSAKTTLFKAHLFVSANNSSSESLKVF